MTRRAARKDNNHNAIAKVFKDLGWSVADTSRLGEDFPDMVVGKMGFNVLIEIKRDDVPPSKSKLTEGQFKFFDSWRGHVEVVRNLEDVLKIDRIVRQQKVYEMRGFIASAPGQKFAHDVLDPEKYGFQVSAEVRDAAREVVGIDRVEADK